MRAFILVAALSVGALDLAPLSAADAPATIRVTLPADATLTVDGQATQSTSADRWFVTPALASGQRYFYNFKASFVRDGKTITVEQKVPVRAGRQSVVSLDVPGTSAVTESRSYYYAPEAPSAPPTAIDYNYPGYYVPVVPYVPRVRPPRLPSDYEGDYLRNAG